MKCAIILTVLSISVQHVFGHHSTTHPKVYTESEWDQILKDGFGHCNTPGQPCAFGKRTALAVAQAISFPDPKGRTGFVPESVGTPAKPEVAAVPDQTSISHGRFGFCSVPSMECATKRDALDKIGRAAENAHYRIWAREAEAEAAAEANPRKHPKMGFCSVIGMACTQRRDLGNRSNRLDWCSTRSKGSCLAGRAAVSEVEEFADVAAGNMNKPCSGMGRMCLRHSSARQRHMGFCSVPGMACMQRRSAKTQPDSESWCSTTGMTCFDRRQALHARLQNDTRFAFCGVPGSTCTEKREIDDFEELGLSMIEGSNHTNSVGELVDGLQKLDPEFDKRECYAEHGPCSDILRARDAFQAIKNSEESARAPGNADMEIPDAARAHLSISHLKLAREAEESCNGPEGACTNAKRAIDELEIAINEAVALL
nr:hypothetical protein CFP56_68102 [Quercus suber]